MEAFVVKILASLLISVLITTNIVAEKLSMEIKFGKTDRTLGIKNNTTEETKEHAKGNRRMYTTVSNVFDNDNDLCYRIFFAGKLPPTGLRDSSNKAIKYICQPDEKNPFYSTMFDQDQGIAVVAAYSLGPGDVAFQKRKTFSWTQTLGIAPQGSDDIYGPKFQLNPMKFQKGHLISKRTFSSTEGRCASTYKYTNAVPQAPSFNNDGWKEYEIRIRRYAQETCPGLQQQGQPILFLLTGTSSVGIQQQLKNPPQPNTNLPVGFIGDIVHGTINIPNSMWTAACCVHGQQTKSFAVIGNNVNDKQGTLTQQVTVKKLQDILQAGTYTLNTVTLFPGNMDCADETNNVLLPERWRES